MEVLTKLLEEQRGVYEKAEEDAKQLLATGDAEVDETLDPGSLAAWTAVASSLLNLEAATHR